MTWQPGKEVVKYCWSCNNSSPDSTLSVPSLVCIKKEEEGGGVLAV